MQSIKVELNGVAGLFIPFSLIVGAILTAKLIELGACWLFNLVFWTGLGTTSYLSLPDAQMSEKLILSFRDWCGYCVRVQDVISKLGVNVEQRNIWENEEWKNDLVSDQGRSTVPVLCRITTGGETHWIPESDAIIRYLIQNHN